MTNKKLTITKRHQVSYRTLGVLGVVIAILIGSYFVAANYGFFSGGTNAPSVPEDTMTRGLVGYWEFEEGTGQTAYDASDSSNNGQLGSTASSDDNDPSWMANGKNGGGMEFDGVDDYVNAGSGASLKPVNVTYELWFNTNVSTGQWIINKYQELSEGWGIRIASDVSIYDDINNNDTTRYATAINTGQWYHVVAIMNNLENKLYLDGVLIGSGESSTGNFASFSGTTYFGQRGNATNYFNGSIDSVRIYNRALSADEVRYHYNRGGPVGSWDFDEGSGLTAFDSTGNNNDGTLKSSGLEFDGSNDYVDCGTDSSLDITGAIAIEMWIKPDLIPASTKVIVQRGAWLTGGYYTEILSTGVLRFVNNAGGSQNIDSTTSIVADTWYHVVFLRNGTFRGIYINGVLNNSDNSATDPTSYSGTFYIDRPSPSFDGSIDEVRIYNTALDAAEIARHYNNDFSQDPTANLVLLQHFEEGLSCQSGACLTDDSGNGNDGTPTNFDNLTAWDNGTDGWISEVKKPEHRWTNGKYKTAGNFDGGGDNVYQTYDSDFDFGTGSFSVSSWFKHNTIATSGDYLLSRYDADQGFKIWMDLSGDMCFGIDDDATWDPDDSACTSGVDYDDNAWHHLSAYKDGTTGIYLYIDGSLVSSDETIAATATLTSNSAPLRIGSDAPNPLDSWEGMIDNVMIYPYVREPGEIRLDYNAGVATHLGPSDKTCSEDPASCMDYGLVGSWGMDEGTGTTAYDSSDNSNNGTLTNGPTWTADSSPLAGGGGSLSFDGVDDYVDCGNDSSLNITDAITISAWSQTIIDDGYWVTKNYATLVTPYMLTLKSTSAYEGFSFYDGSFHITGITSSGTTKLIDGSWHNVTGTYDGLVLKFYIDGSLDSYLDYVGSLPVNTNDVLIGAAINSNEYHFNGSIDSVRIYNRALSAEEVRYHYNKGGPVAEWKFDEGSGQTAFDDSSNNNDGTLGATSGVEASDPTWVEGKYGGALSFDGGDDYMEVVDNNVLSSESISISMWAKPVILQYNKFLLYKGSTASNREYSIGFQNSDTNTKFSANFFTGGTTSTGLNSITIPQANVWYHIVSIKNLTTQMLYINGVLESQVANTNVIGNYNSNLYIGSYGGDISTYDFNGSIDDVRIYNYARSADEIRLDYNAGVATHLGPAGKDCDDDPAGCVDYGLVGSWGMDEGTGTTAYDSSDNSNDGTLTNGLVWTTDSSPLAGGGGSLKFDGVDDYVTQANVFTPPSGYFSIEFWMKGASNRYIMFWNNAQDGSSGTLDRQFSINIDGAIKFRVYDGSSHILQSSKIGLDDGNWHHVVGIVDGAMKLYIDGVIDDNTVAGVSNGYNSYTTPYFLIGKGDNDAANMFFNGSIDSVRIYNRALSAEEVRYHYNKGGPVAEWKFDEGSGQTAFDESFNNNDGTLGATAGVEASDPTWVEGKYGGALSFDGEDDYVEVADNNSLDIAENLTVSVWVKPEPKTYSYRTVISKGTNAVTPFVIRMDRSNETNSIWGSIHTTSGTSTNRTILTNGDWYHIVLAYDGSFVTLFVNGISTGGVAKTGSLLTNNTNLMLGKNITASSELWSGSIDDVRIYNYACTAEQIQMDYNAGVATHFR